MNEHVKELAVQARIQMCSEPRLQEFAELIIKECAGIVNEKGRFLSYKDLEKHLKKHFGIYQ